MDVDKVQLWASIGILLAATFFSASISFWTTGGSSIQQSISNGTITNPEMLQFGGKIMQSGSTMWIYGIITLAVTIGFATLFIDLAKKQTSTKNIQETTKISLLMNNQILKNPIIVGLITLSVFEAIILVISWIHSSSVFDYKFFTDITLVLIPLVGGAFTSKWVANSWQQTKERNEIRRRILTEFTESTGKRYTLMGEFAGFIYNSYLDFSSPIEKKGKQDYLILFPKDDNEKPFKKHIDRWKQFEESYWKLTYLENNFYRSMSLYYADNDMMNKIIELGKKNDDTFHMVHTFFESRNLDDYNKRYSDIKTKFDEILPLLMELESKLILTQLKIR